MVDVDPITYEVIRSQLDGITKEMQASIYRIGYSTLIRETHDMSCGIVDRTGRVVAQFAGIPIHLGSYPACIDGLLQFYDYDAIEEGDCFFVNHPYYSGCAHSLDSAVITPVFYDGEIVAFLISITHKGDIGGLSPGSRAVDARDLFGEGMLVPPVKFLSRRQIVPETERLIRANTRTPELLLGDYHSQAGPEWSVGVRRLTNLMTKHGKDVVLAVFDEVGVKTEQRLRAEIGKWRDGVFEAEAFLDNDLVDLDTPVRLHVAVTKSGDHVVLDFSGSADQNLGPLNVTPPIIQGSCLYALVSMMDDPPPNNHGVTSVIEYKFRPGSVLDPIYPAPVGFYSSALPTIEEMLIRALTQTSGRPSRGFRGSNGLFTLGTLGPDGRTSIHYELMPGGSGAFGGGDGWTGCGHGGSGPKITCVEIVESEYPVMMQQFKLVPDSGGAGEYRGGLGYIRDYLILGDAKFSGGGGRYKVPPLAVDGGTEGQCGYTLVNPDTTDERKFSNLVSNIPLVPGDIFRMYTGSGAGVGQPKDRDAERVADDLRDGYISPEAAKEIYGLSEEAVHDALKDWL